MSVKCPKCNKEIEGLRHFQSGENSYDCWIEGNSMEYQHDEFEPDNGVTDYECPECHEVLATSEEAAMKILSGGGVK
jgi:phage FluMu protein Com